METENPQTNQPQTENPQTETDKPDLAERVGIVEAILFVTGNAVEKSEICRAMGITHEELEETLNALAVIAYRQPVTKAEIELIRGVKCDYSVQMLVSRGLIEEVGRKEALGRPILYGTTDAFLRHFCLTSLADLPEIDFSALADRIAEAEAKQAAEKPKADPVDKLAQNIASEAAEK